MNGSIFSLSNIEGSFIIFDLLNYYYVGVCIFGSGLEYGIELLKIRDLIGGKEEATGCIRFDPLSNPEQKGYLFITIRSIFPLSF